MEHFLIESYSYSSALHTTGNRWHWQSLAPLIVIYLSSCPYWRSSWILSPILESSGTVSLIVIVKYLASPPNAHNSADQHKAFLTILSPLRHNLPPFPSWNWCGYIPQYKIKLASMMRFCFILSLILRNLYCLNFCSVLKQSQLIDIVDTICQSILIKICSRR